MATRITGLRIPEESLAVIDANAEHAGLTRTAWMIQAAMHYEQPAGELDAIRARLDRLEQIAGVE